MKHCARCGKRLPADRVRIYSKWTRNYYCFDMVACARRARRRKSERPAVGEPLTSIIHS